MSGRVVASRWRTGFVCPDAAGKRHSVVTTRGSIKCSAARVQTLAASPGRCFRRDQAEAGASGSRAMLPASDPDKQGISSIELGRVLALTQTTVGKIKHKLAQVCSNANGAKGGCAGARDRYDCLHRRERPGRQARTRRARKRRLFAPSKTAEGKPVRLKLGASRFRHAPSRPSRGRSLDPAAPSSATGLAALPPSTGAGMRHVIVKTARDREREKPPPQMGQHLLSATSSPPSPGTYRSVSPKARARATSPSSNTLQTGAYDLAA